MATQMQLRRGTTAENNIFTGAQGEITYDTETNGLRIHNGAEQGGFHVPVLVAVQYPTADNDYTWYRLYSDGWVEMGGQITIAAQNANTNQTTTVNLPIEMSDTNYYIAPLTFITDGGNTTGLRNHKNDRTTTTIAFGTYSTMKISSSYTCTWQVCGVAKL